MDALQLARANNHIRNEGAIAEDEDGVRAARVGVGVAVAATIEFPVAIVDRAGDNRGRGEGDDASGARGDIEGLACCEGR